MEHRCLPIIQSYMANYSFSYSCLGAMNNNFLCNISLTYDNIYYEFYIMNSPFIAQSELIMKADCVYVAALNISAHCTRSFHGQPKVHSFVGS